jgi:creatinine amidohydrolase/Fe(II)-dependent formamide hydrolase-like protein/fructoselysine-6-P-deglycase FrlB-like protein
MPSAESAAAGRALLEQRVQEAPEFVARMPRCYADLLETPMRLPRSLVTTGIGTSEGHARHMAEVSARWLGQPARFATTASLANSAPPASEVDWLVVFSQGLSPNARYALHDVEAWGGVLLVTGLPGPDDPARRQLDAEKRAWLEALQDRGVIQLDLGCGTEYGALLRVIGARCGYAAGWSILRSLLMRQLRSLAVLDCDPGALRDAQDAAKAEARRVFPEALPVRPFFEADRSLILVAEGGMLDLADQLSLKIAEGMLRPAPRCMDVLHFAHGPLQSHFGRRTSILYLAGPEAEWVARFRSTLDLETQDLRVLEATLREPFCVLEFEAMLDDLVLRSLREGDVDLVDWPGRDREGALYEMGPEPPRGEVRLVQGRVHREGPRLDERVWTEVESDLALERRTALICLGSIEQHGPHLPLGTDHWIADALARGLAARLGDALALPAVAVGCAREHLGFPGTLNVEPETLEYMLGDLLESLLPHGFDRVFVWTAHGGNVDALDAMRERLAIRAEGLQLVIDTDLGGVAQMQAAAVRAEGIDPDHAGPHAGEYETSLVAALRPGSIRRGALAQGRVAPVEEAQAFFDPSLRPNAPTGVVGDPSNASADRGIRYLNAWLDLLEANYRTAFEPRAEKKRK